MKAIRQLTDQALLKTTRHLVSEERRLMAEVLRHLQEVERRGLHLREGYSSIYDFCTRGLRYSEGSAYRRIAAMRLLNEVPEIEAKIREGSLHVTAVAQAASVFKNEIRAGRPISVEEKRKVLSRLENQSKRECERVLAEIAPQPIRLESERVIAGDGSTEIRFVAGPGLMEKLRAIEGLLGHRLMGEDSGRKYAVLLDEMADLVLEKLRKTRPEQTPEPMHGVQADSIQSQEKSPSASQPTRVESSVRSGSLTRFSRPARTPSPNRATKRSPGSIQAPPPVEVKRAKNLRYIPAAVKRQVWLRDRGKCSYRNPSTGQRCTSRYALEIDHRWPVGLGGENELGNLRLVCRAHNQHFAREIFRNQVPKVSAQAGA